MQGSEYKKTLRYSDEDWYMISEQHRIWVGRLEKGNGCRLIVLYFSQLGLDNNSTILALSLGGAL